MSGGVDSSVSALLLKNQGYDVEGWYMKNWNEQDETGYSICPAKEEYNDVQRVCKQLNIPCRTIPFEKEYWNNVFEPCLEEYMNGYTPNPDVYCNREIKFKSFLNAALKESDYVATGHYCQLYNPYLLFNQRDINKYPRLIKGIDVTKDQSYFLCEIPGHSLSKVIFPVGNLHKTQVRTIANENHLVTATKKDSFGICFIGERNMKSFLSEYINMKPGPIYTYDNILMGQHTGLYKYTIGQCIQQGGLKMKYFVANKDIKNNKIIIAPSHHSSLYTQTLYIQKNDFHWIDEKEPIVLQEENHLECQAVTRYHQPSVECTVELVDDKTYEISEKHSKNNQINQYYKVTFKKYVRAITPGQICAFYVNDVCLGGGSIYKQGKSVYELGYDGFLTNKNQIAN